jgi:hypothetical protein
LLKVPVERGPQHHRNLPGRTRRRLPIAAAGVGYRADKHVVIAKCRLLVAVDMVPPGPGILMVVSAIIVVNWVV